MCLGGRVAGEFGGIEVERLFAQHDDTAGKPMFRGHILQQYSEVTMNSHSDKLSPEA